MTIMISDGSATLLPEPLEVISEAADAAAEAVQALARSRASVLGAPATPSAPARPRRGEDSRGHKRDEPAER